MGSCSFERSAKGQGCGSICVRVRTEFGRSCPPVQKMGGRGLARLGKDEYHEVVLIRGLVPAWAFRASRSEAAPYGSDKRKIDTKKKTVKFSFANSSSFQESGFVPQ